MTRIIAALSLVGALLTMGCHNNKPAQTPAQDQPQQAPPPVQGPPP